MGVGKFTSWSEIQTSCGEICILNDNLTICTQSGANTYKFRLIDHVQMIDFRMRLPERYWHICNGCGMIAPRTCGDCVISMDKLYWGLTTKKGTVEEVIEQRMDMLKRIQNEPWSLLLSEEEENDEA